MKLEPINTKKYKLNRNSSFICDDMLLLNLKMVIDYRTHIATDLLNNSDEVLFCDLCKKYDKQNDLIKNLLNIF
jgi:hypothetical protein